MRNSYIRALRRLALDGALSPEVAEKLITASAEDGGPGSGNFGHKGRPGQIGGSGKGEGGGSAKSGEKESTAARYNPENPFMGEPASKKVERLNKMGVKQKNGKWVETKKGAMKDPEAKKLMNYVDKHNEEMKKSAEVSKFDIFAGKSKKEIEEMQRKAREEVENHKKYLETVQNGPPSQRSLPYFPSQFTAPPEIAKKQMVQEEKNFECADWCWKEKEKFPKDSDEYKAYELYENVLADTQPPNKPSASDTEKLHAKVLGNISPKLRPYAVDRYRRDVENEPHITADICEISNAVGTTMYGINYRLKEVGDKVKKDRDGRPMIDKKTGEPIKVCRYQEKIEQDMAEAKAKGKKLSYKDAVDNISDLVRYTQSCTEDNLVSNYEKTRKMLEKKGYKVAKVKNYYNTPPEKNPYRGLNCVFVSPTGTRFELQFHTPRSLVAKEAQHNLYEKARTKGTPKKTVEQLNTRMRDISNRTRVPYPKGIEKVENYPPETKL